MAKQVTNLQDVFLNTARKEKLEITLYLVNGVPIKGRVLSFDNFTILLDVDKKQNLIYKHAISTLLPSKPISYKEKTEEGKGDGQE
ncbi:MAG: RNA chaperone Hfq [bacterium]|nr:RNA chaperone Hfq [bacterium]